MRAILVGKNEVPEHITVADGEEEITTLPLDADTLEGHPAEDFALAEDVLPWQDPGFAGMLYSYDEEGNGVQAMAGDSSEEAVTSYISTYSNEGTAELGVTKATGAEQSYLSLSQGEGNSLEIQTTPSGSEIAVRAKYGDYNPESFVSFVVPAINHPSLGVTPNASLLFKDKDWTNAGDQLVFMNGTDGLIRVSGVDDPANDTDVANKRYVDTPEYVQIGATIIKNYSRLSSGTGTGNLLVLSLRNNTTEVINELVVPFYGSAVDTSYHVWADKKWLGIMYCKLSNSGDVEITIYGPKSHKNDIIQLNFAFILDTDLSILS